MRARATSMPCRSLGDLANAFLSDEGRGRSRRGRETLEKTLALVELFLAENGVASIDFRDSAPDGVVRAVASLDTAQALLRDFENVYLSRIKASIREPTLYRESVCDFQIWLYSQRVFGPILTAV